LADGTISGNIGRCADLRTTVGSFGASATGGSRDNNWTRLLL
jgi:hypothetical protein